MGTWTLTDDGEFVLNEPYATMLREAKAASTNGWVRELIKYLEPRCPYTPEQLKDALLAKNAKGEPPLSTVDEFILQALGGEL